MKMLINQMDFQKCGEIVVAAKHNVFAMSCTYCQQRFSQLQAFMRHLQLQHSDKLEFGQKDKNVEVYAVEELMTTLNQTTALEAEESEESQKAGDDGNWLTDEDQKWLDEGDNDDDENMSKGSGLVNMSILKALEDCDVSLNLVDDVDETMRVIKKDKDSVSEEEEEEDDVLNNTLLKQIQNDWGDVSDLEEQQNKTGESVTSEDYDKDDKKELKGDVTMTDIGLTCGQNENMEDCLINTESLGLKGLLAGLEDLEDVDSLLENLEDSLANDRKENDVKNFINSKQIIKKYQTAGENIINHNNIEAAPVLEDLDLTVNHKNNTLINKTIVNYNLALKKPKDIEKELPTLNKNQQKMMINIESGELESIGGDLNHLEDSLEEENLIFDKFIQSSKGENEKTKKDFTKKIDLNQHQPKLEANDHGESEEEDFEEQLKKVEELLANDNIKTPLKITKNSLKHKNRSKDVKLDQREDFDLQLKSLEAAPNSLNHKNRSKDVKLEGREDFDSQLKNLEATLNEDNDNLVTTNPQKVAKLIKNSPKTKINKDKIRRTTKKKMKQPGFDGQLKHLEDKVQEISNIKGNPRETEEIPNMASLNIDLTKALEEALEGDDLNLLNMQMDDDNEPQLNQDLKDLLALELQEEVNEPKRPTQEHLKEVNEPKKPTQPLLNQDLKDLLSQEHLEEANSIKSHKNIKAKRSAVNPTVRKDVKIEKFQNLPLYESRYEKTNLKAKNMRQQPLGEMKKTQKILEQPTKILKNKSPLKISNENRNPLKGNHEINLQHLTQKPLKPKTPKKSSENQENLVLRNSQDQTQKPLKPKTPKKSSENQENLVLRTRPGKPSSNENMENFTPALIKKIKQEKFTPQRSFINTERGDRTPLQTDEMFLLKQSPNTKEKQQDMPENFTPKRGERTPKTKEQMFLKQSPKTKEKQNENLYQDKTPKRGQKTPKTRPHLDLKQSPKTQEKNEFVKKNNLKKTPGKLNLDEAFSRDCKVKVCRTSPLKIDNKSPPKNSQQNSNLIPVTTPQRLKNLQVKLPRLTPVKLKETQTKSPQKPTTPKTNNKLLDSTENVSQTPVFNGFKLPNGITLTKISPSQNNKSNLTQSSNLDETPIKTNYCKQNFSEGSLDNNGKKFSLIQPDGNPKQKSLKTENSNSLIRQRKASIDIVPKPLTKPSSQYVSSTKSTPKHSNLDYKSYAVNRSARKKEVLQRMRHIKKQIFKSIENGQQLIKFQKTKSPPNKPRKSKLQIQNVQILPNIKRADLTPLINPFDNFKKPLNNNVITPLTMQKSPKNLNDDEKQAKKYLHKPGVNNSSINDDEKIIKKSLKRSATSPLLEEGKPAKRLQKSPSTQGGKDGQRKSSSDLETTQLGLSESVVEFLQRDLKRNQLNVASFLNDDFPLDDNSPNETSIESNGKETKPEDKAKDNTNNSNNNILDDLLNQVDNEQNSKEATDKDQQNEKSIEDEPKPLKISNDFDESKDLNLLNKFGLKIIKTPDLEDHIPLEEVEEMQQKAHKFAGFYENWPRIWSSKTGEHTNTRQDLNSHFDSFLIQTNLTCKVNINMNELRRLVNLITLWYSQNFNNKLIEKKKISEATNRYLLLFHYIPKTIKRLFYCEYCEEYFNTEHRYYTHRISHTGAAYPYQCIKCSLGFRSQKPYKDHELQCNGLTNTSLYKCNLCSEMYTTSTALYEHSKTTHLKTAYNCVKCDLVFATATDVQKHMTLCNRNVKRIPKQLTPRPPKMKVEK